MVRTRANVDIRSDKHSSDHLANGHDREHVSHNKKKRMRVGNHDNELCKNDSSHKRKHKKLRQSIRQKEKKLLEQCPYPKRSHRQNNSSLADKMSSASSENENEAENTNENCSIASDQDSKSNNVSPYSDRRNKLRNYNSEKNDCNEEENSVESEEENEVSRPNKTSFSKKRKVLSSDSLKRRVKKRSKHKKNMKLTKGKIPKIDRKLRSSMKSEKNSESSNLRNEHYSESDQLIDMYTRVKRDRKPVKKDVYGMPVLNKEVGQESRKKDDFIKEDDEEDDSTGSKEDTEDEEEEVEEETSEEDEETESDDSKVDRSYNLRKHRKPTNFYMKTALDATQKRSSRKDRDLNKHNSEDDDDDGNDSGYDKARSRNMRKRIYSGDSPLNINGDAEQSLVIDRSVNFGSIGGLDKHIMSLKEMVIFPFLYPEFFHRFKIRSPKGVLFYGPPGTGKTLVARALANECSYGKRRVSFFLRKGSDCLSKWVGESEKHLRVLFDQANQMKPSIIFFDEIDGLIPIRSGKHDHVHNSIVSTLLALMDGLDDRGEVIIIGSTNRIDSIDPAFRRPGRFDRELLFPLPAKEGREQILKICTREWSPGLSDSVIEDLASATDGYSGADLKGLCTEAALIALKRRYPQIFFSQEKLIINVQEINVTAEDFALAMRRIIPSTHRSFAPVARALPHLVRPLLQEQVESIVEKLDGIFPPKILQSMFNLSLKENSPEGMLDIPHVLIDGGGASLSANLDMSDSFRNFSTLPPMYRPRFLICGKSNQGQTSYLCPAVLQKFEGLPIHVIDLASTFSNAGSSSVEIICHTLQQCKNCVPSILYMPNINLWWNKVDEVATSVLVSLLEDLDPCMPLLVLASSSDSYEDTLAEIKALFVHHCELEKPSYGQRKNFFSDLILKMPCIKPTIKKRRVLEKLPVAPPPESPVLSGEDLERVRREEDGVLRKWRRFLRTTINKLWNKKEFTEFQKPVDETEVPDYYDIIKHPMDLYKMRCKVDLNRYKSAQEFLDDIDLIHNNALEYNPVGDSKSLKIRRQARHFKDFALNLMEETMDVDIEKLCQNVNKERLARGEDIEKLELHEFNVMTETKKKASSKKEVSPEVEDGVSSGDERMKASRSLEEEMDLELKMKKGNDRKRCLNSSEDEMEGPPPKKSHRVLRSSASSSEMNESLVAFASRERTPVSSQELRMNSEEIADKSFDGLYQEEQNAEECDVDVATDEADQENQGDEETDKPQLIVNLERLKDILKAVLASTEACEIDELVRLYNEILKVVCKYKDEYNKESLEEELERHAQSIEEKATASGH